MPFKKFAQLLRMGSARKSPVIETYITQPAFALRLGAKPGFGTRPSEKFKTAYLPNCSSIKATLISRNAVIRTVSHTPIAMNV